ncbi:hypothetical protein [Clostridium perfringens]|nr:hypothetical protein [Clostridium perfringens]MDH5087746.1 hypothetical protein [Clostridium perfringens]BDA29328.1 hypothetical protein CPBEC3_24630 [Clostridium perfringens]
MCLYVEKQYNYIHELEGKINAIASQDIVVREGYNYLNDYPLLSAFIHRVYNFFLPIFIIVSMVIKIYFLTKETMSLIIYFNIFLGICIILITFLYILFVYREIKFVSDINNLVKKIFVLIHLYEDEGDK